MTKAVPDEVTAAVDKALDLYGQEPWFNGVGVSRPNGVWHVSLLTLIDEETPALPAEIMGIPVDSVRTGKIVAQ